MKQHCSTRAVVQRLRQQTAFRVRLCFLVLTSLAGALLLSQRAVQAAPPAPRLQFVVPGHAAVGQPLDIMVMLHDASDMAGYETTLLFDPAAAHFSGLQQRGNDVRRFGRAVEPVGPIELPQGVTFGFYSCPVEDCVKRTGQHKPSGARGTLRLSTLTIVPTQAGELQLHVVATKVVDARGNLLPITLPATPLTIQVGPRGGPRFAAPSAPWTLSTTGAYAAPTLDLTNDGRVTHADAMEVALEWAVARMHQTPCGLLAEPTRDVNVDGCIDIADLQMIAAGYTLPTATREALTQDAVAQEMAPQALAGSYAVNSRGDEWDARVGDGICATAVGTCTLRAAINEANARQGPDTITFVLSGSGVQTIKLGRSLPTLFDESGATVIDGYTQSGATVNTAERASNAGIKVQLEGGGPTAYDALRITSAGNTVRGLAFYNFRTVFWITGSGATENRILGSFVGTDATSTYAATAFADYGYGINIENGAARNQVGSPLLADRNVLSGNARHGIGLWHEGTRETVVRNNIIGLSHGGTRQLANQRHGVDINYGSASNIIGGTGPYERNVISGNKGMGVELSHTTGTRENQVVGNFIGTDLTGRSASPHTMNSEHGVMVEDGAHLNLIANNVIGNNGTAGIGVYGAHTTQNQIRNNRVGLSVSGAPIPNREVGIRMHGTHTTIGPDNIVAYNPVGLRSVEDDKDFNLITRNAFFANDGLGIDLATVNLPNPNDMSDDDAGPNEQLNYPLLELVANNVVTGTACAGCTVELFIADGREGEYGEGKTFLTSGTVAPDGRFAIPVTGVADGVAVTATATDLSGNTSEFSLNLAARASTTPSPQTAADAFTRTLTGGWGQADTGGPYTILGDATRFGVNGMQGTIRHATGNTGYAAILGNISASDVNIKFKAKSDKAATGTGQEIFFIARRTANDDAYRGRVRLAATGQIYLQAYKHIGGQSTGLSGEVWAQNVTHTATRFLWIRAQVTGSNPATISIKVWNEGTTEPAQWQYTITDSSPALQTAGAVGVRTNIPANNTNAPILFAFDDLQVIQAR